MLTKVEEMSAQSGTATAETLTVTAPRTFTGEWPDAWEVARQHNEPVFVPITVFADDRG